MLQHRTSFPHVGSFALLIDKDLPPAQQRAELVRILRTPLFAGYDCTVAFPLRQGASGTRSVPLNDLIDGTALDAFERRELADLDRDVRGRTSIRTDAQRVAVERRDALKARAMWSVRLDQLLRQLPALQVAA